MVASFEDVLNAATALRVHPAGPERVDTVPQLADVPFATGPVMPAAAGPAAPGAVEHSSAGASRRRMGRVDAGVTVVVLLALITALLIPPLTVGAAVTAALAVSLGLVARLSPPAWLAEHRTERGADRTMDLLAAMPDTWTIRHDVRRQDQAGIDHVVVGPAGVFVLESKVVDGRVRVEDGALIVTRADGSVRYRHRRSARSAALAAVEVNRALSRVGEGFWVHAVVVVWSDMPQRVAESGNVTWVRGDALAAWLQCLPDDPRPRRLARVANKIDDALRRL